jgi:hypothetical protein
MRSGRVESYPYQAEEAMQDRRQSARDKVLLGGVAEINDNGSTMDCVVRNFSEGGACVELESAARLPDQMRVTIARKGRSYLGRMIWRQANRVGLAFKTMIADAPADDLDVRLRRSEAKKRQLQRRIKELLGEG